MEEVLNIDLIYFYVKDNAYYHKTSQYEVINDEIPVLRRGQKFTIALRFSNRNYQRNCDDLKLIFNYGPNPNPIKGTQGIVRLDPNIDSINEQNWYANILGESDDSLTLEVCSPSNCPVGLWKLKVESGIKKCVSIPCEVFDYQEDIYILFNPWNQSDEVYMPDKRLLDEYVLNDVGKIWIGPWGSCRGRQWIYGQFHRKVFPAIRFMFERSKISPASLGCPIKITRCISQMVNSNDDEGILVGKWDGEYEDGTAPSAWTGSINILKQYLKNEKPVKYGQCWVFSGVVTTICRALGIPSRVVSNLVSAHDANASLTVDKYFDENNEEMDFDPMNEEGKDSIWNYHVWNDVWMTRPDLPIGYGGWQAIDATPQETSSGYYQCGPASLEAIKTGAMGYTYDVGFMIASVNADLMRWKIDPDTDLGFTKIYCNKYHIGRMLITKKPWMFDPNGDRDREEITNEYKGKEGTQDERLSLYNAVRKSEIAKSFYDMPDANTQDIQFDLVEMDRIKIGENFSVIVHITNNCNSLRKIRAVLSAASVFYTGVKANLIKKAEGTFNVKPKSSEKLRMIVNANDYLDKLVEYSIMKLYAMASVEETRQTWADEDDFQVLKPNIDIIIDNDKLWLGTVTKAKLHFTNPLNKSLTQCKFYLEGINLLKNKILEYNDIEPFEAIVVAIELTPRAIGEHKIVVTFDSKELTDIIGAKVVQVL